MGNNFASTIYKKRPRKDLVIMINIPEEKKFNHNIEIVSGVMEEEIASMMKQFFKEVREKKGRIN